MEASAHLGAALGAVRAADVLDVTAAMLVAAAVAALEGLRRENRECSGLDSRCKCKRRKIELEALGLTMAAAQDVEF